MDLDGRAASAGTSTTGRGGEAHVPVPLPVLRAQLLHLVALRTEAEQLQRRSAVLADELEQRLAQHWQVLARERGLEDARWRAAAAGQRVEKLSQQLEDARWRAALSRRVLQRQAQALLRGAGTIRAAEQRLREAQRLLAGPAGVGHWLAVRNRLVIRRCVLAKALADVYQIGPKIVSEVPAGVLLEERMDWCWWTGADAELSDDESVSSLGATSSGSPRMSISSNRTREVAKMVICGLELPPSVGRRGYELEKDVSMRGQWDDAAVGSALGFVAHVVSKLSLYLGVPVRYPLYFLNSRSLILDQYPPLAPPRDGGGVQQGEWRYDVMLGGWAGGKAGAECRRATIDASEMPLSFPLYFAGADATRFAYATFLLSKDIEQLLAAHGLSPVGPAQLLHNLHKLLMLAASAAR